MRIKNTFKTDVATFYVLLMALGLVGIATFIAAFKPTFGVCFEVFYITRKK